MPTKPSAGAVFAHPVRVYWEDTDAGGIVFYANYLKFFERARTEWLRSLGIEQRVLRDTTGGMFVVSQTDLRYLAPARLDDVLQITAKSSEIGRSSMVIVQEALLISEQPTRCLCRGSIRIGWVHAASLRPARMPPVLLDALHP
ncbi:MAG: tol-pal system-associated acyl-CoA thioesterase [Burkholderiaceae bacterium]